MSIFDQWKLTADEFDEILATNPSLRGFTFGYIAEFKLKRLWFSDDKVSAVFKYDDHSRKNKGDLSFIYKGLEIKVESKSLQTNSIRTRNEEYVGKFQCDASDRRTVTFPNGEKLQTTCLLVGEFDLVAVNLFSFQNEWRFAFAKNKDLPRSKHRNYTPYQKEFLLATLVDITWPLKPPFETEPFRLLDELVQERDNSIGQT